jgi:hypothetical protein
VTYTCIVQLNSSVTSLSESQLLLPGTSEPEDRPNSTATNESETVVEVCRQAPRGSATQRARYAGLPSLLPLQTFDRNTFVSMPHPLDCRDGNVARSLDMMCELQRALVELRRYMRSRGNQPLWKCIPTPEPESGESTGVTIAYPRDRMDAR